ncbi:hypothetical protein M9458_055435 [Cirrhinus mrigala]|uniref:TTF-type domain-containing protein n=1 Tax=Cirrhinus mrigala TaxID=683832 RepID=A0ABD0MK18_CIRMR
MEKQKRKGKGGAEKLRAKKIKILEVDASTCAKITDMFSAVASVSKPTVPDDTLQKQVNIAHGGEVTSHGGTQAEEQVSDSEVKEGQSEQECVIETASQVELAVEERDREEQAVDYFARPTYLPAMMQVFLNHHPKQDVKNPVVKKVFTSKDSKSRKWLTYCHERHAFCFLCLAFSKPTDSNQGSKLTPTNPPNADTYWQQRADTVRFGLRVQSRTTRARKYKQEIGNIG